MGDSLRCVSGRGGDDSVEGGDEGLPVGAFAVEFAVAFGGEGVDAAASAAAAMIGFFPDGVDFTGGFETVEGGVEGAFFELEESAAAGFEAFEDFEAVGFAMVECGEDEEFEVASEFVAVNFHDLIIDCLGIGSRKKCGHRGPASETAAFSFGKRVWTLIVAIAAVWECGKVWKGGRDCLDSPDGAAAGGVN
jgi:hypothetical protein